MGLGLVNPAVQNYNASQRLKKTITFGPATASGTSTAAGVTSMTDSGAAWVVDAYVGLTIYTNGSYAVVTTNSPTVLTVASWIAGGTPTAPKSYMIAAAGAYGDLGDVPVFDSSGTIVVVRDFIVLCTASVTSIATPVLSFQAGLITGVNVANNDLQTDSFVDNLGINNLVSLGAWRPQNTVIKDGIVARIGTSTIIGGSLDVYCYWDPVSPGATLV